MITQIYDPQFQNRLIILICAGQEQAVYFSWEQNHNRRCDQPTRQRAAQCHIEDLPDSVILFRADVLTHHGTCPLIDGAGENIGQLRDMIAYAVRRGGHQAEGVD